MRDYFVLRCKLREAMNHPHDYSEIVAIGSTPFMSEEFTDCKDNGSL